MVGRTFIKSLLAILFFFNVFYPGRDTQDSIPIFGNIANYWKFPKLLRLNCDRRNLSSSWYSYQASLGLLLYWSQVLLFRFALPAFCLDLDLDLGRTSTLFWSWSLFWFGLCSGFSVASRFFELLIPWFYAAISVLQGLSMSSCRFQRKHGRWRCSNLFPIGWMILSTVALSSHQVHGFASHGLHRRSFVGSTPYVVPRSFVPRAKSVTMRDIVSILNDTFFLSKESDSFYDPRFLDTVFDGSESDPFMATADVLSAHGSFIANTWLSEMASASSHPLDFNLPQDVDSILDDILAPPAVFDCLDNSRI